MPGFEVLPTDPVDLAFERAQELPSLDFELSPEDELMLAELEYAADRLGFFNRT